MAETESQSDARQRASAEVLFQSIGDPVIATNEQARIMRVNAAALKALGYTEKELIGKWYPGVMPATDLKGKPVDVLDRPVMRSILDGEVASDNLQYTRKDGSRFPAHVTSSPVLINGKPFGTIQVFRDITIEQQIDRAKTEFVSVASHQLRTPLTAIRWYLELMLNGKMGKLSAAQHTAVSEVLTVNLRLIDLVRSLLSVAHIELDSLAFSPEPSDIIKLAQEIVFELQPQITAKRLKFSDQYDPTIPLLQLDQDLTRVVFQNLLSNAVKYTPRGGSIHLGIMREGRYIHITVADTGYGVPKHQRNMIFTKLFRADNVRRKEMDGTGLGLYIIQSIVQESGGKVWFDSEEDKGSTFHVRLPLKGMKAKTGKSLS